MLTLFSHAGHSHGELASELEHCMPILIGGGIIIAALVVVIIILTVSRTEKKPTKPSKK